MGSAAQSFVASQKANAKKTQTQTLQYIDHALMNMESEAKEFERKCIQEVIQNKELPVSRILKSSLEIRCSVQKNSDEIVSQIKEAAGKFMNKEYAQGISTILGTAVNALLGKTSSSSSKKEGYFITVGQLGSIQRVDYMIHVKRASNEKIQKTVSNFMSMSYIVSSAKLTNLSSNDLLSIVQVCYSGAGFKEKLAVLKLTKQILDNIDRKKQEKLKKEQEESS